MRLKLFSSMFLGLALVGCGGGSSGGGSAVTPVSTDPVAVVFTETTTPADYVAGMGMGFNAGNYLDSGFIGGPGGFINAAGLAVARKEGLFSHFRLPVNFAAHADAAGVIEEAFLATYVDPLVTESLKLFPRVVLDLHHYYQITNTHIYGEWPQATANFTAAQHTVRLVAMWNQIATRYKSRSNRLSFDLLNEPYAMDVSTGNQNISTPPGITSPQWNTALAQVISTIRATGGANATRLLWVEPYEQASLAQLNKLTIPADANVGVSVHIYDPFSYTHGSGDSPLTPTGLRHLKWSFELAKAWANTNNRVMWVGETGANTSQTAASRLTYYQAAREYGVAVGLPVAFWDWNTDFGIYKKDQSGWIDGMLAAVSGAPAPAALPVLPADSTPTTGVLVDAPDGLTWDAANRTITWVANTTPYIKVPMVVLTSLPSPANGEVWTSFARQFSGDANLGISVVRPDGTGGYTTVLYGFDPLAPGGYEQKISGVQAGDKLAVRLRLNPGVAAGSLTYSVWKN